jgi:putative radical SAM enzyme (TIGR03279 family)
VEIVAVTPDSLADEAGIQVGSRLVAVNGREVRDFVDVHLWLGEEILDLSLEPPKDSSAPGDVQIVRAYARELGLTFKKPHVRRCGNDCPFCFVDQLPDGLRKNLYIRDDDYRFSYMYGHFITLTNIRELEFERIIDQQLSPLYISVHALDPEVRERILVSKRAGEIRRRIEQLLNGGIELHTQVVVVPGVNDGEVLQETIFGLAEYYPGVRSVSVVPVGLTAHRQNLPSVRTLTPADARGVARTVRRFGRTMRRRLGAEFCYVADELVILAERPIPPASYYGDFGQRENGVGLVRSTLMHFGSSTPQGAPLSQRGIQRVWILTGESFASVLRAELPKLRARAPEITLEMIEVENKLFGRPVTVAGLLGGQDLLETARPRVRPGDLVLVPDEAVNEDGIFLDDRTPADLSRELGVEVVAGWEPLLATTEERGLEDAHMTLGYPTSAGATP